MSVTITSMTRIVPSLAAAAVIVVTLASCASSQDPRPAAPVWGTATRLPGIDRTEWTCVELTGADGKPIAVTPPTPVCAAALNACYFAIVCTMAAVVLKLARFIVECVGDHQLSAGLVVFFELADALATLCAGGAATVGFLKVVKKLIEILRETQRHFM